CQWLVTIPPDEAFPPLNLAHAALLVAYTIFKQGLPAPAETSSAAGGRLAGPAGLERFYQHLEATLNDIGVLHGDQAPAIMITLRRIFGRANLEPRDVKILRGVLGQMEWYKRRAGGEVLVEGDEKSDER